MHLNWAIFLSLKRVMKWKLYRANGRALTREVSESQGAGGGGERRAAVEVAVEHKGEREGR
jgi:hypothetical protein